MAVPNTWPRGQTSLRSGDRRELRDHVLPHETWGCSRPSTSAMKPNCVRRPIAIAQNGASRSPIAADADRTNGVSRSAEP